MRGSAASMTVLRPKSVRDALALYANTPAALPLAGGTDIMVAWNLGDLNDRVILDLSSLAAWTSIARVDRDAGTSAPVGSDDTGRRRNASPRAGTHRRERSGDASPAADAPPTAGATTAATNGPVLRIGSLATHTALQRDAALRRRFALLVEACATVGGVQIQNRGTLGGNIANASPAGDTLPPLAVYDARVHVASASGRRVMPFLDIFAGVKKTTLQAGELIEAIDLPLASRPPDRQFFRKVGTRSAQAISKTVLSGLLWLDRGGTVRDVRLALGSMAPTVRRLRHLEAALTGCKLTPAIVREALPLVAADVSPIDDARSTAAYRLTVSQALIEAFLLNVGT